MPRQQVGLRFHDFCELPLQDVADVMMQLLPLAPQQGTVGSVLNKRVLEGVLRVGGDAPLDRKSVV